MRDYSKASAAKEKSSSEKWIDYRGNSWHVCQSVSRLKFCIPSHAALRAHIFYAHNFKCARCSAKAIDIPVNYDGRYALQTDTFVKNGYRDVLILDHILTRKAGGRSIISNLQTLCETCNKSKQKEDKLAVINMDSGVKNG
jgi:5-methylcytosine-specific restriction endonuclease McrA